MKLRDKIRLALKGEHRPAFGILALISYIGPGLLVTVGFIDPGNWASNIAAGSDYGYRLLWIVTLSTLMLIILQHNVAHLGIATGLCLAEAITKHTPPRTAKSLLASAMLASISTSLAEVLGGAIALNMLFGLPLPAGAAIIALVVLAMLLSNSYKRLEKWVIGFVAVIGFSYLYELALVDVDWKSAAFHWVTPSIPGGSMIIIMSILGAVVMPHNLFLHSEIIQSRQWNLENESVIRKQLDFELFDTLFSMIIGWAINSAIIIMAAATFFTSGTRVTELQQAENLLRPLLGNGASIVFAIALLFAGTASSLTSAMAGGTISAGFYGEPYNIRDNHSRLGACMSLAGALLIIFLIKDPFRGLIISQMLLSMQLPLTIVIQIHLTSSKKVMGPYVNSRAHAMLLWAIAAIVIGMNILLLASFFR